MRTSAHPPRNRLTPANVCEHSRSATTLLRTSARSDPSDVSRKPRKFDDLDAPGPIYTPGIRLRDLWTSRSVVVRVHSGALGRNRPRRRERSTSREALELNGLRASRAARAPAGVDAIGPLEQRWRRHEGELCAVAAASGLKQLPPASRPRAPGQPRWSGTDRRFPNPRS
jgi:hypothetical protein